jgi:hypothetical protein
VTIGGHSLLGELLMPSTAFALDLVEELRLRRWAREHYVAPEVRSAAWHPVVHEEMELRDLERSAAPVCRRQDIVPLAPAGYVADRPHELRAPRAAAHHGGELHYT